MENTAGYEAQEIGTTRGGSLHHVPHRIRDVSLKTTLNYLFKVTSTIAFELYFF